jgi:hypothetical protein
VNSSKPTVTAADEKKISVPSQVTVVDDVAEDGKTVIVVSDDTQTVVQKAKALVKKNRKVLVFVASAVAMLAVGRVVRSRSLVEDTAETEAIEEV